MRVMPRSRTMTSPSSSIRWPRAAGSGARGAASATLVTLVETLGRTSGTVRMWTRLHRIRPAWLVRGMSPQHFELIFDRHFAAVHR
jgi:hypothetical protein